MRIENDIDAASWLHEVRHVAGHAKLLEVFQGDYLLAAYRLACMVTRANGLGEVPTEAELFAAMLEIHRGIDADPVIMSPQMLSMLAREAGLAVI